MRKVHALRCQQRAAEDRIKSWETKISEYFELLMFIQSVKNKFVLSVTGESEAFNGRD